MTENYNDDNNIWYKNPLILFSNMDEFFPTNDLSKLNKINSIIRFAIYYSTIIIICKLDSKWLSVSIILVLISLFLGSTEPFEGEVSDSTKDKVCFHPKPNNPFMNFTLYDNMTNPNRNEACNYDNVKKDIRKAYRSKLNADELDIWGHNISDRNFYTMPNTRIVNDQTKFAEWAYKSTFENGGNCKEFGESCLLAIDPRYQKGRIVKVN
jgi:hypothetical protein